MKELTIEQKAKCYDEALKVLHKYDGANIMFTQDLKEEMFPELKESEDERMRKKLIRAFKSLNTIKVWNGIERINILAWLEKQGEPMEINPTKFDTRLQALIGKFDSLPKEELIGSLSFWLNVVQNDGTYKPAKKQDEQTPIQDYNSIDPHFCKPVEHKPIDKIEPKFKIGDWVVYDHRTYKVVTLPREGCINLGLERNGKLEFAPSIYCRPWTIKDARDGDVLFMDNGSANCIFIYKSSNNGIINKYASYNKFGFEGEHYLVLNDGYVIPATKEKRDILEKAMTNAGYTFDLENKELKKIKQKNAWSEEDERMYRGLHNLIYSTPYCDSRREFSDWFESLKNRVQLQQELSEEDEYMIKNICNAFEKDSSQYIWLKSLRLQNRWKPSDTEINILQGVIDGSFKPENVKVTLTNILEQLKKLTE